MHAATSVLNERIDKFTTQLAENGQSATLTHTDSAGKTRSWRVEILGGTDPMRLDRPKADAIAQLFNECQALQGSLLGKRASEGPLIINTQKSPDPSSGWQWSTKALDGKPAAWTAFEADVQSQEIFTTLFTNVDASRTQASRTSPRGSSAATKLPSLMPDPKGIPNLGDTCFMNAALQGLLRMPGIGEYLQQDLKLADGSDERNLQTALASLFHELFRKEKPDSETILEAATTIRNLPGITKEFELDRQHDSLEFLQRIKEMLKLDNASEYCINQGKIGCSEECYNLDLTLSNPDHEISKIEGPNPVSTVTLNLDAQEPFGQDQQKTMEHLFTQYISPAVMPTCRDLSRRIQKTEFTHPNPENLCHLSFVLPRFGTELYKNKGQVTSIFSENLMVPIHQEDKTIRSLKFQAQSVICHVNGETRNSGHYVTIVREVDGFKEISDETITTISKEKAEEMVSRNGYIVNYNKLPSVEGVTSF